MSGMWSRSISRVLLVGISTQLLVGKQFKQSRPRIRQDYALNLSILLRAGKETKWDCRSRGDRKGK